MSHLTAPMPHTGGHVPKPYLYDLPRPAHPLTPPDTEDETHLVPPAPNVPGLEMESLATQFPSALDSPNPSSFGGLHRKRSSVTYVHSGLRESRERVVQRGLKWLVAVVPPPSFAKEHGHLGHTLSSGPSPRLSGGLLMPLYPTLSSQLSAIAREFSFPSISGLCVYLHTNHSGISLTPRVSDDTWPMLWNHLFDVRSPSLPIQQLPIGGQIEFDIDLTRARWYDSWLASSRRDFVDVPQSVAPSHWRRDSQTSINEPLDDQIDAMSLAQQTTAKGRNIKKLSLLDRFDSMSVRSSSRLVPRDESPPSQSGKQLTPQVLSPIVQEDEPLTAKKAIDSRVHSWRMSASAAARTPLAATGQTSLDPVNMPNTIEDLPTGTASEFELNLDDYTWSVSSVGPPDYDVQSVSSWEYTHSVHLDRRGEGSVCLTPSICTSFGPNDDFVPFSPASHMSRLPSPDIAWRMMEDVPPTPTTATSWGAPLEYPPSPVASSYAPSIDIAAQHMSSQPVTPSTATSWGAPLFYPPSPAMLSRAPSPGLCDRVAPSVPTSPRFRRRVEAQDTLSVLDLDSSIYPFAVPYFDASASLEQTVEPQQAERMACFVFPPPKKVKRVREGATPNAALGYPTLDIYPAVYPTLSIYPALLTLDDGKLCTPVLYSADCPSVDVEIAENEELSICLSTSYPNIEIYPAVYPYLNIYPAVSNSNVATIARSAPVVSGILPLTSGYPDFNIYPSVGYPWSVYNIYTQTQASTATSASLPCIDIHLQATYPAFEIYSPVYPHSLDKIYPSVVGEKVAPVCSHAVSVGVERQHQMVDIAAIPEASKVTPAVLVSLGNDYPTFNMYPAVYPWCVYEIYPIVHGIASENSGVFASSADQYPVLDICPAVKSCSLGVMCSVVTSELSRSTQVTRGHLVEPAAPYPNIRPYAPVYPHLEIYPAASSEDVYPDPEIHPAASLEDVSNIEVTLHGLETSISQYPNLVIYPAVYPFIEIYPSSWGQSVTQGPIVPRRKPKYTHIELCAQVFAVTEAAPTPVVQGRKPTYSHMELRVQVLAAAKASPPVPTPAPAPSPSPAPTPPSVPAPPPARVASPVSTPRAVSPVLRSVSPVGSGAEARTASPVLRSGSVSPGEPRAASPTQRSISPPSAAPSPAPVTPRSRPAEMQLPNDDEEDEHIDGPAIVAIEPSPVASDVDPGSPVLFEIVTTPVQARSPSQPAARADPTVVRLRSSTINARPSRPTSMIQPPSSELPPIPMTRRSINRLSGLPPHPAVNRRLSPSSIPRPMSTFGPLPPPPQAPAASPARASPPMRKQTMMNSVREEESPIRTRSLRLPSPPDELQGGFRTPTETLSSVSPLGSGKADLSRAKTMPTRTTPRGPRSSTLVSERMRAFDNPNVVPNANSGSLKLRMPTLAEFPSPPQSQQSSASSPARTTPVSRLDRSKYPFA